jgi:hypothetical protein
MAEMVGEIEKDKRTFDFDFWAQWPFKIRKF